MQPAQFREYIKQRYHDEPLARVEAALALATAAHEGQKRKSGEAYITHPIATAKWLIDFGMDVDTVIAGLLHDVPEDTTVTLEQITQDFGPTVAQLVAGVTKLGTLKYRGLERYVENLRKMFVAMAEDVRVMIIKFSDRLHNLSTLGALPPEKQLRIARESMEIFAPLAHRLGMGEIKGQLEDLAFPYVYPKEYAWVKKVLGPQYDIMKKEVDIMATVIRGQLSAASIPIISVHGRRKHLYSLYEKLIRPEYHRDITQITDLIALRIVVKSVADCYAALGIIHQLWKPTPHRFKDYIAQPKPNGYQSIHTTVFGRSGQPVEIQIRDEEMHRLAEYGVAAHWHYTESGKPFAGGKVNEKMNWIGELAKWRQDVSSDEQYLAALKIDALQKRIFCFTPRGEVIDLPEQATAIDFAYHVHSDLGNRCVGVRINGQMAPVGRSLQSGDVVEVIVDKRRKSPNPDWLEVVRTQTAKDHIRKALRDRPALDRS